MSGDDLSAKINDLSGQVRTLEADLSAALDRAARADSFIVDADRVSREAADAVSGHADTVIRRTERADTLAQDVSALTARLNDAYRQISTLTADRDQATAKAQALSSRMAASRTPNGQGVRTRPTVAAQTYAYVIQLANAYRDYRNQYGGMGDIDWGLMKDLPKYRENVKTNTRNLDTYAMYLLTLYTQRFLNIKKRGRAVPDFLSEVVSWRDKLNAIFTLPVKPPVRKTYKFPETLPKAGQQS